MIYHSPVQHQCGQAVVAGSELADSFPKAFNYTAPAVEAESHCTCQRLIVDMMVIDLSLCEGKELPVVEDTEIGGDAHCSSFMELFE